MGQTVIETEPKEFMFTVNKSFECAEQPEARQRFYKMIGCNDEMQKIYQLIERIAGTSATILIHGESGTGKRVAAQSIHLCDAFRRNNPFIEISCGALPETLLESELFGHVKGAFTGAIKDRAGRFELADGGTLLLDEIDTCSQNLQVKLLRVLEEGVFERVGDTRSYKADVRIIAATNQDLPELVKKKEFREDLYWRLNVITLHLPPLRQRTDDIPLLVDHFLKKYRERMRPLDRGFNAEGVDQVAMEKMREYDWPGNIRELQNAIERAMILGRSGIIRIEDLPEPVRQKKSPRNGKEGGLSLKQALQEPEKDLIVNALRRSNGNCSRAADRLGINRTTLYKKIKLYGL